MAQVRFTGGGTLDGWETVMPADAGVVVTTRGSRYVIDDGTVMFRFAGFMNEGDGEMAGMISGGREQGSGEREALLAMSRPQGCQQCGATFGSLAAYQVHRDPGWPGGCIPGDALGQLTDVDGVLCLPGSDAAAR